MDLFKQYRGLRRELYILFIGRIMTNMGAMIWPVFTLILSQKMGFSAGTIAIYMLVYTLVALPMSMIGGKLADHFNKRNIIIICDLISVAGFLYCGFHELTVKAIVIFSVAGILQSAEGPSYDALVADFTLPEDRERAYSLSYFGNNLGLILSPTIGGLLFKSHLNLAFIINGCSILSSTVLIFFFIKDLHRETAPQSPAAASYENEIDDKISGVAYIKENRVLRLYALALLFNSVVYSMYTYLMPLDLGLAHGENGSVIFGSMTSLNGLVVVLFTGFITRYFVRIRDIDKMVVGEGLELLGYLIFIVFLRNIPLCYVAMTVFTLGEIFNTLGTSPFLSKRIPASHRGRIIATTSVIASLGSSLLANVVGRSHDIWGMAAAWGIVVALGLAKIGTVTAMKRYDKADYPKFYE